MAEELPVLGACILCEISALYALISMHFNTVLS